MRKKGDAAAHSVLSSQCFVKFGMQKATEMAKLQNATEMAKLRKARLAREAEMAKLRKARLEQKMKHDEGTDQNNKRAKVADRHTVLRLRTKFNDIKDCALFALLCVLIYYVVENMGW